jgi:nucleoside-diphosphate-sugar epimerase
VFLEGDWLKIPMNELEVATRTSPVWIICASVLPFGSRAFDHSSNVRIAERVVELYHLRRTAGSPPFVVFISSSSVYGFPAGHPLNSDSSESPVDDYGKSKLAAEEVYRQIPSTNLSIIRPRTVLGQGRGGTIGALASTFGRGLPIPVPPRDVILQLCHVEDLVSLIVHVGFHRVSGLWPAFSLFPKTLEDYVRDSSSVRGTKQRVIRIPAWSERLFSLIIWLKFTPFTPWHIAGFFRSHVFDPEWMPAGFHPRRSSQEAFDEALG